MTTSNQIRFMFPSRLVLVTSVPAEHSQAAGLVARQTLNLQRIYRYQCATYPCVGGLGIARHESSVEGPNWVLR